MSQLPQTEQCYDCKSWFPAPVSMWHDEGACLMHKAHDASSNHQEAVSTSELCGCYCCMKTFTPSEIVETTDNEQTALCPKCGIDSVIGDQSGFPITTEFLDRMNKFWFGELK